MRPERKVLLGVVATVAFILAVCLAAYYYGPDYGGAQPEQPGASAERRSGLPDQWFREVFQFVERLFAHPILPLQIVALALVSWAGLGGGLGVSALFWPRNRWHQLLIGLAVGWVCGQVLFTALILNTYQPPNDTGDPLKDVRLPAVFSGGPPADTSLYPARGHIDPGVTTLGHSLLWTWVGALVLVLLPKVVSPPFRAAPSRHLPLMLGAVLAPVLVWGVYLLLAGITVTTPITRTEHTLYGFAREWVLDRENSWAMLVFLRVIFALLALAVLVAIGLYFRRTAGSAVGRWAGLAIPVAVWVIVTVGITLNRAHMEYSHNGFLLRAPKNPLPWFALVQSVLAILGISLAVAVVLSVRRWRRVAQSPVIVLCVLLILFNGVYGFIWYTLLLPTGYGPTLALALLIGIVLWGVSTNASPFKYSLPNLEKYYDAANDFYYKRRQEAKRRIDEVKRAASRPPADEPGAKDARDLAAAEGAGRAPAPAPAPPLAEPPEPPDEWLVRIDYDEENTDHLEKLLERTARPRDEQSRPIQSKEPLKALYDRWQGAHPDRPHSKPRLVLVCSSGGGVLAAVWAAVVLEGLERELPGDPRDGRGAFRDHIRLLTGASGGMVGAALYAAEFKHRPADGFRRDAATGLSHVSGTLAADSLSPVMQTMLWHDLPSIWLPFRFAHDRGRRLEAAWNEFYDRAEAKKGKGFRTTFGELRKDEGEARCPSLVFSPMLVDDARRLIVSNLDLDDLATAHAHRIMPEGTPQRELLSRSAIEFFRLFPEARKAFTVGTAARMNASFPFISPAVALPTFPPRRIIDAGFYDNFGVSIAALWLLQHEGSIRKYTSGVVLVESRAFRYGTTRRHFLDPDVEEELPEGLLDRSQVKRRSRDPAAAAASWASAPLEALLNLRQRGAFYRNDELLQLLHERLNAGPDESFFTTVGFECPVDAALSWAMSPDDGKRVGQGFHMTVPRCFRGRPVDPNDPETYRHIDPTDPEAYRYVNPKDEGTYYRVLNPRVVHQMEHLREWFGDGGKDVPPADGGGTGLHPAENGPDGQ
ncbi:MAG: DUF998 domain-containing protein [Planctomycetes bacterium]|nr:DUF998 domain-containing protein [Planctomycetota bacterium]